jgi:hypothetical protein
MELPYRATAIAPIATHLEPKDHVMFQEGLGHCWMQNKAFYLGILEEISARMMQLDMTVADLASASGLEPRRLNHILAGMIEDLTLLELDNLLIAVDATPATFGLA